MNAYREEDRVATEGEADYEYALNLGRERRDSEWILSDRDVWYRNPFFNGVSSGRHPEADYYDDDYESPASSARHPDEEWEDEDGPREPAPFPVDVDNDIPF